MCCTVGVIPVCVSEYVIVRFELTVRIPLPVAVLLFAVGLSFCPFRIAVYRSPSSSSSQAPIANTSTATASNLFRIKPPELQDDDHRTHVRMWHAMVGERSWYIIRSRIRLDNREEGEIEDHVDRGYGVGIALQYLTI